MELMEHTRPAPIATRDRACPGCARELADTRCGWCGAAAEAGTWRIQRVLAQTPHSRVYVAADEAGARVALKELHFAAVPSVDQLEAFEREAEALQALAHPRIPGFRQSFTIGEGVHRRLYLAFELIEGESLATRLQRGALDEPALRDIAVQALDALTYLHSRTPAVIHRDVKPGNLVLRRDGTLCLVDFGSVREIGGSRTHRSTLVGTFGYMPPEQLGGTVACSSDVYALGATLLHAATGQPPQDLLDERMGLKVPDRVPRWLKTWLAGALPLEPKKRYRDASAALRALQRPSMLERQVSPAWAVLPALASAALVLAWWPAADRQDVELPPAQRPAQRLIAGPSNGKTWFDGVRSRCNQVEVTQALHNQPPPVGVDGLGFGAACFALGGKMTQARQLIDQAPMNERYLAVGIVFDVAHPIADQGDDESTAPIMKLVVDYWPNHFMALYHLGVAEYGAGDMAAAKGHLERFLALYAQPNGFTHTARRALQAIASGAPYPPLNAAR